MNKEKKDNLMIYVNFPACARRCHFCCWTSHIKSCELVTINNTGIAKKEHINKVVKQINKISNREIEDYKVASILFGGGTPNLWEIEDLDKILRSIERKYNIKCSDIKEVSIDLSPEYLSYEYLKGLKEIGFNRVSLGVQSFNDKILEYNNRDRSQKDIASICQQTKEVFENFNIDLLLGLPGDSVESWRKTLEICTKLKVPHITINYLNKNLLISRLIVCGLLPEIKMKTINQMIKIFQEILEEKKYYRYGMFLWSKDKKNECEHLKFQIGTSKTGDFIGFGKYAISRVKGVFSITLNSKDDEYYFSAKLPLYMGDTDRARDSIIINNTNNSFFFPIFNKANWEKIYQMDFNKFLDENELSRELFKKINNKIYFSPDHFCDSNLKYNKKIISDKEAENLYSKQKFFFHEFEKLEINEKSCLKCGFCAQNCPTGAIKIKANNFVIDTDKCNMCKGYNDYPLCYYVCPTNSINIK